MTTITPTSINKTSPINSRSMVREERLTNEAEASAVSWPAVIAGAFVAAALSLSLLALGAGLGLSAISPWSGAGTSAGAMGSASIVWLIAMQLIAAATGGYVAGRLRTKWAGVHNDEVFFRDTAHGFLVWAVGLVITASLLASAAASMVGGVANVGTAAVAAAAVSGGAAIAKSGGAGSGNAAGTANDDQSLNPDAYYIDALFRSNQPSGDSNYAELRAQTRRILFSSRSNLSVSDSSYLAQLVATRTGISQPEADKRVADVLLQIKAAEVEVRQSADAARKAAMKMSLWMFVGLLAGAFCASLAATFGGRQRDNNPTLSIHS